MLRTKSLSASLIWASNWSARLVSWSWRAWLEDRARCTSPIGSGREDRDADVELDARASAMSKSYVTGGAGHGFRRRKRAPLFVGSGFDRPRSGMCQWLHQERESFSRSLLVLLHRRASVPTCYGHGERLSETYWYVCRELSWRNVTLTVIGL